MTLGPTPGKGQPLPAPAIGCHAGVCQGGGAVPRDYDALRCCQPEAWLLEKVSQGGLAP